MKEKKLTFQQVSDLPTQEKYDYIGKIYNNLTYKRKDAMLYFIDLCSHVLRLPYDTHYQVYKYDFTCTELSHRVGHKHGQINKHYLALHNEGLIK